VGCANRCSEECFLKVRAGALVVSLWNQMGDGPKNLGTTSLEERIRDQKHKCINYILGMDYSRLTQTFRNCQLD
jgi:hypothetical protein